MSIRLLLSNLPILLGLWAISCSIAAPVLEYLRLPSSRAWYNAVGFLCHQLPTRSFFLFTSPLGLCSRCFGIYLAGLFGCLFIHFFPRLRITVTVFFLLLLPCIVDGATQYLDFRISNNPLRFITGLLAGLGFSLYLFPRWIDCIQRYAQTGAPVPRTK